jgi:hypothetical protein
MMTATVMSLLSADGATLATLLLEQDVARSDARKIVFLGTLSSWGHDERFREAAYAYTDMIEGLVFSLVDAEGEALVAQGLTLRAESGEVWPVSDVQIYRDGKVEIEVTNL